MIASLAGIVQTKSPGFVVVDVNGVGYAVSVSLHSFCLLPEIGASVSLHIHSHIREDTFTLFGFTDVREREVFLALIGINKVGPKLALNILSGLAFPQLIEAVVTSDIARLSSIPGIGKKTAGRLSMKLADKFAHLEGAPVVIGGVAGNPIFADTVAALQNLGYKKTEAEKAATAAIKTAPDEKLETILTLALQQS